MIELTRMKGEHIEAALSYIPISFMRESIDWGDLAYYIILLYGSPIGAIVVQPEGDTCEIRHLYIREENRHQGYGYEAMLALRYRCEELGYRALSCRYIPGLNPCYDRIMDRLGFKKYSLPFGFHKTKVGSVLKHIHKRGLHGRCISLGRLEPVTLRAFGAKLLDIVGYGVELPLSDKRYDMAVSCVIMNENACAALLLVEKESGGEHYIRLMYNDTGDPMMLVEMITHAAIEGRKLYGDEAVITAVSTDEDVCRSIEYLGRGDMQPMAEAVYEYPEDVPGMEHYMMQIQSLM